MRGGVIGKIHELSSSSMHCNFMAIVHLGTFVDLFCTQLWTISQFPSIFDINFLVGELVNMISASRPLLD